MRALKAILAVALFWLANMGATVTAAPASGPLAARAQELVALLHTHGSHTTPAGGGAAPISDHGEEDSH